LCFRAKESRENQQQGRATKTTRLTVAMQTTQAFNPADLPEEPVFDIVTNFGTIRVKLYKETPLHRDNFVKLASENFYDGIRFHRVIKRIYDSDRRSTFKGYWQMRPAFGTGGPGYTIPAEILPQFNHKKGALAAARRGDDENPKRESSGSQFYIVEDAATCAQLDGAYTVFGETIDGLDVVDKIAATPTNFSDRPTSDVIIKSVKPVL
jgi:cyclophilin family peptidyl-prolyl cis-trans isomerase